MTKNRHDSIPCAHYISKYLPLTENWIHRIIINHTRYRPIILSRKKANLDQFPIADRYTLDDRPKIVQYFEILFFLISGYFNFFKNVCKKYEVQVLHVHFGYHGVKSVGLKKKLNIPMICSFYGDDAFAWPHIGNNMNGYRMLFQEADLILALGPYMRSELIALGCPEKKVLVHHLGIAVDRIHFEKRTVRKGESVKFLIASSFVEKKGIDIAIRALSRLKNDYVFSLDIIGDGPLKNKILKEIEEGGISGRVTLHGYKPYDFFIDLAHRCDIFIQASRTTAQNNKEGTPMAIVDAMAAGMTIVATRHSDIPEIVPHGECGLLAEENDVDGLEHSLRQMLDQPEKIEVFSLQGRQRVEKEFNAKEQTIKLEAYYSELIRSKTTRKSSIP